MGFYAFFRLTCRPAILVLLGAAAAFSIMIVMGDALILFASGREPDYDSDPAQFAHLLNMGVLGVPLIGGLLSADLAYDVRTRSFSWLLPHLDTKLLRSAIAIALAVVTGSVVLHLTAGGPGAGLAVWGVGLLVFAAGHHLLDRPVRRAVTVTCWCLVVAALIFADPLVHHASRVPIVTAALGMVGAAAILRAAYARANARELISLEKALSMVNVFNPIEMDQYLQVKGMRATGGAGRWLGGRIGGGVRSWTRAVNFEAFGYLTVRRAWRQSVAVPLVLMVILVLVGFQDGYEIENRAAHGWLYAWHALMHPAIGPGLEEGSSPPTYMAAAMLAVWFYQGNGSATPMLSLGRVYPLSRAERARVAWHASLGHNMLVFVTSLLAALVVAGVVAWFGELVPLEARLPGFLRVALAGSVLAPFAQYIRLRSVSANGRPTMVWGFLHLLAMVVFTAVLVVWTGAQGERLGDAALLELGLFFLLAVGGQLLFRAMIDRHYARADLV
jgi:hypothetical protein